MGRGDSRARSRSRRRGQERDRRDNRDRSRGRGGRSRSRGRDRDRGGRGGDRDRGGGGRRRSRSRSRSRSRRGKREGKELAILATDEDKKKKRASGWDEPPPGVELTAPVPVAAPPLGAPAPQMPGVQPPEGAPDGAAGKTSSIQAALEAQKKMLAAKAAGMGPGVVPPPPMHEPGFALVDPAITLAIAKAKAAALRTCMEAEQAALTGMAPALAPGLVPPACAMTGMGPCHMLGKAGMLPPLRPGMISMSQHIRPITQVIQPGLSALSPLGSTKLGAPPATIVRPPLRPIMPGSVPVPPRMPLTQGLLRGSTTSKASMPFGEPGSAPAGATAKGAMIVPPAGWVPPGGSVAALTPPGGLGNLTTMKEVSPALAQLMQGGLF